MPQNQAVYHTVVYHTAMITMWYYHAYKQGGVPWYTSHVATNLPRGITTHEKQVVYHGVPYRGIVTNLPHGITTVTNRVVYHVVIKLLHGIAKNMRCIP